MRLIILSIFLCSLTVSIIGMDTYYRTKRDAILFVELGDHGMHSDDEKNTRFKQLQNDMQTESKFLKESSVVGFIISAMIGCFSSIPLGFAWNELSANDDIDCMQAQVNCFYCTACIACVGTCAMAGMAICDCCKAKDYAKRSEEIKKLIKSGKDK